MGKEHAGAKLLDKRLRLTLEFRITAREITRAWVAEYYRHNRDYEALMQDEEMWVWVEQQNHLMQALVQDEQALREYLTGLVVEELGARQDGALGRVLQIRPEEAVMLPVLSRLAKEEAAVFSEAIVDGTYGGQTELLLCSFGVEWERASLEEIETVKRGVVELAVEQL